MHTPAPPDEPAGAARLVLLRHGESVWNRDRRFTGWADVELTARGREEARAAGELLAAHGLRFDACFSSVLRRSGDTARIVLAALGQGELVVQERWRLNERHCGALQGLRWWQALGRYGPRRLLGYRRDHAFEPPLLREDDPRFPGHDPRYAAIPPAQLPRGESVNGARARLLPCWEQEIAPRLRAGGCVLVVSHKNILRALLRLLAERSGVDVGREKIATGEPLVITLGRGLEVLDHRSLHEPLARPSGRQGPPEPVGQGEGAGQRGRFVVEPRRR